VPTHAYTEHVSIAAPPAAVWAVMSDVQRWPTWTESVREVALLEGDALAVGAKARIRQPRLPVLTWTVDRFEAGRFFSWTTSSPGMTGVAEHGIEPRGQGSDVTLVIRQSGPAALLARLAFGGVTRRYLRMEAEGLKRAAEQRAR
jgi:uncharacterized membrane protein